MGFIIIIPVLPHFCQLQIFVTKHKNVSFRSSAFGKSLPSLCLIKIRIKPGPNCAIVKRLFTNKHMLANIFDLLFREICKPSDFRSINAGLSVPDLFIVERSVTIFPTWGFLRAAFGTG